VRTDSSIRTEEKRMHREREKINKDAKWNTKKEMKRHVDRAK
jgi:hypothetical protein